MNSGKIKYIFILAAFFFISKNIYAQNELAKQYEYAVSLYNSEKYFDAITEAKRLAFFDTLRAFAYPANELIAECYKQGGKYPDAIFYYKKAERYAKNKDEIYKTKLGVIKTDILRKATGQAIKLIDELKCDTTLNAKELSYWRGWAYIFNDEWDAAAECFDSIDHNSPLKLLCQKVEKDKYSVLFAKVVSVFIPGAGQFYTGNYLSGIMSLGWNFLWGYISVNSIIENRVFDAAMTANFLWLRFYLGNIQNAEKFAEMKNLEITNNALIFLQNNFNGEKP
jgi:hypothetical protein